MAKRWAAWAAILLLAATLAPVSKPGTLAQAQPVPDSWPAYDNVTFGYTVAYPAGWEPQVSFENPPGQPHIIRQRIAFHSPQQAQVEIDVWDRDPALSMDQWFSQVEHITTTVEINALISGQDAYLRVMPGSCGVPIIYAAYIPYGHRVYEISHPSSGDPASLSAFDAMLRSFALHAVDPATRGQISLPDYLPSAPLTCDTNICPSTCWYGCTFAAISEGCCGYHPVPKWQCAKECVGDQPGDFLGNCVWWGAYTRPDVGALAKYDAQYWADVVRSTGQLPINGTPKVGDIVVHPGDSYNHVAYVVWVSEDRTSYMMSDMGWCGDCGPTPEELKLRTVDADDEFIHCAGDPPIPTVDWQFTDCPFGWTPSKGFAASLLDGYWGFDPAVDPFLLSPVLDVPASQHNEIELRVFSHAADTTGTIYFTNASSPDFDEAKSVNFAVTNDGSWHEIIVDMSGNAYWQGTITRLRVDPVGNGNADGSYDDIGIDHIRILPMLPHLPEHVYLPLVLRRVGTGEENQPPYEPADPWPPDGAVDQLPPLLLTWTGGDPDEEEVTYDVYLDPGDAAPLTPVCQDLASPACSPVALLEDTSYRWQVLATDARGASTLGPVWGLNTAPAACVNLVANGGFEIDSDDWYLPSTVYPARYSTAQARNGSRSMQVGIVNPAQDKLSYSSAQQVVTIPTDAARSSLRFWLYTISDEPETGTSTVPLLGPLSLLAEDAQYVFVYSEAGTILRRRYWQPPLDNRAWTEHTIDLSAFAGQTVKLYFGVFNDGDGAPTGMYVDEVTLVACPP